MATRLSNALHLEVLEAYPVRDVPLEVTLWDGANPATMVAALEGAYAISYQEQLSDVGSGTFRINRHDPKAALIHEGDLIKIKTGGIHRFAYWVEEPEYRSASAAEEAGDEMVVAGRGALAYIERAVTYPPGWPVPTSVETAYSGVFGASILLDALVAAQARGGIPALTWDFTDLADSQNAVWTDVATLTVHAGTSCVDLWRNLVAFGSFESRMDTDLKLRAYVELGRHFEDTVIFRRGRHILDPGIVRQVHGSARRTRYLVEGQGGELLEISDPTAEVDTRIGRREAYLSVGASSDPTTLQRAGEAALAESALDARAYTVTLAHGYDPGDLEPYTDYAIGDWVTVDDPGNLDREAVRIVGWTISETTGGGYAIEASLNSIALEADLRLRRQLDALSGGSGGGGVSGSVFQIGGGSYLRDGRVASTGGDQLGYLMDKLSAGAGIAKTLAGTAPDRRVEFACTVAPVTPAENVAAIADPPSATAPQVAAVLNELLAALEAAGLMEAVGS